MCMYSSSYNYDRDSKGKSPLSFAECTIHKRI